MPFHGPVDAIERVLRKLGLDPRKRITEFCQDPEYTACRADELPAYFELYCSAGRAGLDPSERDVLCCFLLEALNDFCANGTPHDLQLRILEALFAAEEAHGDETASASFSSHGPRRALAAAAGPPGPWSCMVWGCARTSARILSCRRKNSSRRPFSCHAPSGRVWRRSFSQASKRPMRPSLRHGLKNSTVDLASSTRVP